MSRFIAALKIAKQSKFLLGFDKAFRNAAKCIPRHSPPLTHGWLIVKKMRKNIAKCKTARKAEIAMVEEK